MSVHPSTRTRVLPVDEHRCDGCGAVLIVVFKRPCAELTRRIRDFVYSDRVRRPDSPPCIRFDGKEIKLWVSPMVCFDTREACEAQLLEKGWTPPNEAT